MFRSYIPWFPMHRRRRGTSVDVGRFNTSSAPHHGFRSGYPMGAFDSWPQRHQNDDSNPNLSRYDYGGFPVDDVGGTIVDPYYYRRPFRPFGYPGTNNNNEPKKSDDVLRVEKVDFNIPENTSAHQTNRYDCTRIEETSRPKLVVRRGKPFDITLTFNRPYDRNADDLRLVFQVGDDPIPSKKTHVEFILSDEDLPKQWGAKIRQQERNGLRITVFTPPDCYVAKWNLKVDVVKKANQEVAIYRYNHSDPIYIIFNPWCKDDTVFIHNPRLLDEYVLNENGRIYAGTYKNISAKPWNFGQFQDNVLDCAMYLLDISEMKWPVRGNPINVVRKLTALINAPDDGGVLVGNWSGNYEGGKSPLSWSGSVPILEQFYRSKMPVRFGQCWVFSGVLTTVCRALGIPARSVTNFASAHDTDGSVSIDIHFDANGNANERENRDSIWNFHVWNEAWMARPDLKAGYGGWQAIDATPQETSDGVYCCGPASVNAIKDGELGQPYDGPFVFAEVNADRIYWLAQFDGSMVNSHVEKNTIGRNISTKVPLRDEREDVTGEYKFHEGSNEERMAVMRANQTGSCRSDIYQRGPCDVEFELVQQDDILVGEDFDVILKIKNLSQDERYIQGRLGAYTMYYTGVSAECIVTDTFESFLQGGRSIEQKMNVKSAHYAPKLKDMCMLKLTAMAQVQDTKQVFTKQEEFRLCKPDLTIKVPKDVKVKKPFDVEVSFTNPFGVSLTDTYLEVEGPGLVKRTKYPQRIVKPKQTFVSKFEIVPKNVGDFELVVIFNSAQLEDINVTKDITVA